MAQLLLFSLFTLGIAIQAASAHSSDNGKYNTILSIRVFSIQNLIKFRYFFLVSTCKADGKIYHNREEFRSGVDKCASCICIDSEIECDDSKCRDISSDNDNYRNDDYTNINNQLLELYFSQFRPDRLKSIKDRLGCKTYVCPQLMAKSEIDYTVVSVDRKEFVGRTTNPKRTVFHTTSAEVVNNNPLRQEITTVGYSIKVAQSNEATITKTRGISAGITISIMFLGFNLGFKFEKTTSVTSKFSKETTLNVPSQKVLVDPYTKFNVTFKFYQYEDIDSYFLDFVIGKDSKISHPDRGFLGELRTVKLDLIPFLRKNSYILPKLKYRNETDIKIVEKNGEFVLKNFPATVRIINFGVDVAFGKTESIKPE